MERSVSLLENGHIWFRNRLTNQSTSTVALGTSNINMKNSRGRHMQDLYRLQEESCVCMLSLGHAHAHMCTMLLKGVPALLALGNF